MIRIFLVKLFFILGRPFNIHETMVEIENEMNSKLVTANGKSGNANNAHNNPFETFSEIDLS